jgi:hypothetical protein
VLLLLQVTIDPTTYAPTGLSAAVANGGVAGNLPAAFCTSSEPVAASSSNNAYQFVPAAANSNFVNIGKTGSPVSISGAAVVPKC